MKSARNEIQQLKKTKPKSRLKLSEGGLSGQGNKYCCTMQNFKPPIAYITGCKLINIYRVLKGLQGLQNIYAFYIVAIACTNNLIKRKFKSRHAIWL